MGNIFKFFLYILPLFILIGCEKINVGINCEKFLDETYINSSLELAEIRILLAIDDISDKYLVPEIIS